MPTLKYSRQRESIKENLMHRTDHPTADMVYSDIRRSIQISVWAPYTVICPCCQSWARSELDNQ